MKGNSRGAVAIEFALASIVFFTVLLAVMDFAILGFVNLTMQHAVREGARYAVTGRDDLDPGGEEHNPRYRAVIQKIRQMSIGFFDRVVDPAEDITITDVGGSEKGDFGGPGETVVIKLNCTWPLVTPLIKPFFPGGEYHFTVGATMRNELF